MKTLLFILFSQIVYSQCEIGKTWKEIKSLNYGQGADLITQTDSTMIFNLGIDKTIKYYFNKDTCIKYLMVFNKPDLEEIKRNLQGTGWYKISNTSESYGFTNYAIATITQINNAIIINVLKTENPKLKF